MPSKSNKQARFMAMLANNPEMAREEGVPMKVAKEFNKEDKGGKLLKKAMRKKPKGGLLA